MQTGADTQTNAAWARALAEGRGLLVLRASRLETLAGHLHVLLAMTRPEGLLAAQTVIAAHPGMRPWILDQLALHAGPGGVVANVDVVLASAWLDALAQARLGQRAVALPGYRRGPLTWTLHELLAPKAAGAVGVRDARVAAYLDAALDATDAAADAATDAVTTMHAEGERARRRHQLAEHLAGLFQQYLVYRPDWLRAWQRGDDRAACGAGRAVPAALAATERELLAPLWRAVSTRVGVHRADLLTALQSSLRSDGSALAPLHVFGLAHLSLPELALLREVAAHTLVFLYLPDPCREYWGGLEADARAGFLGEEATLLDAAGDGDYWHPQTHPLLARWGRLGQHFFASIGDGAMRELTDLREQPAALRHRLGRVQESIRALDPALLAEDPTMPEALADASLRVHACHTRLRELEVLRDAILDAIEHRGVRPQQIVVMAPDIAAYAPLLPAVFGSAGDARARLLPYHLTDLPLAQGHRLLQLFARLLALPGQRLSMPEFADVLAVPEVQRRFDLDGDDVTRLREWLASTRVAWALDGAHRARFGVPPIREHTFAWALDRLLAGYLLPTSGNAAAAQAVTLPDGTRLLPVPGADGPAAAALGALDALLVELQRWLDLAHREQPLSAWTRALRERLAALWRVDTDDADARSAEAAILRALGALDNDAAVAGLDPELHFRVLADLLQAALAKVPEQQHAAGGGITVCGMVPQRALPFAMVCVLGLGESDFPRRRHDSGLDLMRRLRRVGDRDAGDDDRYLFLETVMAARVQLHLSWIGQSVADNHACNPAPPLAELLAELDRAAGLDATDTHTPRPWYVQHPLHPFDPRYHDAGTGAGTAETAPDPRLFAYREGAADLPPPPPLPVTSAAAAASAPWPGAIALAHLCEYWRYPARNLLEHRLGMSLAALDVEQLPEHEPLDDTLAARDAIPRRVFFERLAAELPMDASARITPPDWLALGGLLPPGAPGARAWQRLCEQLAALDAARRAHPALGAQQVLRVQRRAVTAMVPCPDHAEVMVTGQTGEVVETADGSLWVLRTFVAAGKPELKRADHVHFGERVPLFLDWALLRLSQPAHVPVRAAWLLAEGKQQDTWLDDLNDWESHWRTADARLRALMTANLHARLARLLGWWHDAAADPLRYFPHSSWQALARAPAATEHAATAEHTVAVASRDADTGTDTAESFAAAVQKEWAGDGHRKGERGFDHYTTRLGADLDFNTNQVALRALTAHATELGACLRLRAGDDA